jgi:hypothetical protein
LLMLFQMFELGHILKCYTCPGVVFLNTVKFKFQHSGCTLNVLEQGLPRAQIANRWNEPLHSARKT